jgi:hypothetical protein
VAIRLFFEYNNQVVQLPVNPASLAVDSTGNNTTVEIVALGEINILRQKKLSNIKIECFFPALVNKNAPYVLTSGQFKEPQFYIDFFEKIRSEKKPARFIVTDTKINMLIGIEAFTPALNAGDDDTSYMLELKEYKPYATKTVTIQLPAAKAEQTSTNTSVTVAAAPKATTKETRPPAGFSIGDEVTVSGNYWYSSYGDNPHGTFNNFRGKISHIVADKTRKYRFHITTLTGGYRGWVAESQMKH